MAGRAYEDSTKWYADILDQCAGKCDWLEASLLKVGADGLGNLVYGALGAGSLLKPGQTVKSESPGSVSRAFAHYACYKSQPDALTLFPSPPHNKKPTPIPFRNHSMMLICCFYVYILICICLQ
jgi:hypothetical protein